MRNWKLPAALVVAVIAAGAVPTPAAAAGDVSCRASAARAQLFAPLSWVREPVVANDADSACADDAAIIESTDVGQIATARLEAHTDRVPDVGDPLVSATASSRIINPATSLISLLSPITASVVSSAVSVRCVDGAPVLGSSGRVENLRVKKLGGATTTIANSSAPSTISLGLIGKLHVNRVTTAAGRITRQALVLDTLLIDIVVGESSVAYSGAPCTPPPPRPACSDGVDNGDAEDVLADAADPGCLSGPGGAYDPADDDETDPPLPAQCADGVDNADAEDVLADADDPGCHSGPGGAYDPADDDETDPIPPPLCGDGVDNDGDAKADGDDPGCLSGPDGTYDPADDDETDQVPVTACSDGIDNADNEDLLADAADPGCLSGPGGAYDPADDDETDPVPPPACSDGRDNDSPPDGKVDAADPGCLSGPGDTYNPEDADETDPPPKPQCSDGIDNDNDGQIDDPADSGCSSLTDNDERGQCQDGIDNADPEDTLIDMADPGCQSPTDNFEGDPQCLNGIDDDGDLKIDYPDDPGCTSRNDASEGTR